MGTMTRRQTVRVSPMVPPRAYTLTPTFVVLEQTLFLQQVNDEHVPMGVSCLPNTV
jgi:hypothetical protein